MTVFHREEGDASSSSSSFTCSAFSASQRHLLLGTSSGHLQLHNIATRGLVAEYPCHTGSITHLEPSRVHTHSHTAQSVIDECGVMTDLHQRGRQLQ